MKIIGQRTLKTGLGASFAMIIAQGLGLKYALSAGIITILSIQNTKRKSFKVALERIESCILALGLSSFLFIFFGYNVITFGVFLLLFIPLSVQLKISEGIVVNSVLVTHLLTEKMVTMPLLLNEFVLMLIGVSIALILNLHMPSIEEYIKKDQAFIEGHMKIIFLEMAKGLRNLSVSIDEDIYFKELEERLYSGRKKAYINLNNYFISDEGYYIEYMEMRIQQFETMKKMRKHFSRFFMTYEQTEIIANFTEEVGWSITEKNTAEDLLIDLNKLREGMKKMELPTTREEFENRAMLYQYLNDIEEFLEIKKDFSYTII